MKHLKEEIYIIGTKVGYLLMICALNISRRKHLSYYLESRRSTAVDTIRKYSSIRDNKTFKTKEINRRQT